jgi:hypothetical protein
MEKLAIFYTPPDMTSSDFYFSEINKFNKLVDIYYEKFYRKEYLRNRILTIIVCIGVIFATAIIFQYLTFADISNLLSSPNENTELNMTSFALSLLFFFMFYILYFISIYFIDSKLFSGDYDSYLNDIFSNYSIAYYEIIKIIVIPILIYLVYTKFLFWFFFYTHVADLEHNNRVIYSIDFTYFNMFRNVKEAVLHDGALAYIYLIRIYNLFLTVIFSMLLFYLLNVHLFFFTPNHLRGLLVFNAEKEHYIHLKFYAHIELVTTIYLFMQLIYFFNYPRFSKTRQVFDSIFVLYDMKIINSLGIENTCEKQVLKSSFILDFLNFDFQSRRFHLTTNGMEFQTSNLSEVIINFIYYCDFYLF